MNFSDHFLPVALIALLLVTGLQGCGALVVGGAAGGGYYVGKDERTLGEITDDAAITSAINARFIGDNLVSALDINVDTYRGKVILSGHVHSAAAAERAVQIARATKGVVSVTPHLEVVGH